MSRSLVEYPNHYKIVMISKTNFTDNRLEAGQRKYKCENNWRIVRNSDRHLPRYQCGRTGKRATGRNGGAQVASRRRPTDNQRKGGRRRDRAGEKGDDVNGKWNYEVVVRTNGKEWGFEVDPNGKLLKHHSAIKR